MSNLLRFSLLAVVLLIQFQACDEPANQDNEWEPMASEEISSSDRPPCISDLISTAQFVVTSVDDYESIRRQFAPEGNQVNFHSDGVQRSFRLPYQPIGYGPDGIILPRDILIWVHDVPLYVSVNGELIVVTSVPIYIDGDSILIFRTKPPYTVERRVHYQDVLSVDSVTGEVTFNIAPQAGGRISLRASRFFETYDGQECSMIYFDFDSRIMIGKLVTGNSCLKGLEKDLYLDHAGQQLIYLWRKIEDDPGSVCKDLIIRLESWITVEKPPAGYDIVFIQD